MDLRNYGVIDFAEHVVLPTGDADDLDDLTHENVEVGAWYSNGSKQRKIDEITQINKNLHSDLMLRNKELAESKAQLLKIQEVQRRSEATFAYQYSELVKTAEDRDKKEKEIKSLKATIQDHIDTISHQKHIIEEVEILVKPSDLADLDPPEAEWYAPPTTTPEGKKAPFAARAKTGIKHSRRTHDKRI